MFGSVEWERMSECHFFGDDWVYLIYFNERKMGGEQFM